MTGPVLLRYTRDQFLVPEAQIRVLWQRFAQAEVHWHEFYELVYVLDGSARHVVNGTEHRLGPGSAFLLTPADFHEIVASPGRPLTCYNVIIDPAALAGDIEDLVPSAADQTEWLVSHFSEAEPDFERLWMESQDKRSGTSVVIYALVHCILVALARRCGTGRPAGEVDRLSGNPDAGVRRAIRFIDRYFRGPLSLADVAAQAHLSPNYFSERFHEITGISFQTYLQQRRLRFARSLLAATDLGVTEICHAAGFNSLSHFGRAYRRRYGHSPSAARDEIVTVANWHGEDHRAGVLVRGPWGTGQGTRRGAAR